jgi:hypothetical protein
LQAFREFAGRIEAAVAIGNLLVDSDTAGLVGRVLASEIVGSKADPIGLESLVQQLAVNAYAGPSEQLGASFASESGIPGVTEEVGLALSKAVEESIGQTAFASKISAQPTASAFSRRVLAELGTAFPIGSPKGHERLTPVECMSQVIPEERAWRDSSVSFNPTSSAELSRTAALTSTSLFLKLLQPLRWTRLASRMDFYFSTQPPKKLQERNGFASY